jgi:DNA-binding response OmpR family regulator
MIDHRHAVLIIEDDPEVSEMMATTLAECDVSTAREGSEALRLAANLRPCVIFLDLMLPGMSGWQFLEEVRMRGLLPRIPIIAVTASDSAEGVRSLGAADYLKKPFRFDVLKGMVTKHCQKMSEGH